LNFLRSPESYKPVLTAAEKEELLGECKYYGIDELMFPPLPPPTQKQLTYRSVSSPHMDVGNIAVLVDHAGVHTIADSAEEIKYCPHCHRGFFNIGGDKRYFRYFNAESQPSVQPKVQSPCPMCRH
jgi:hypothetical protein